MLKSNNNQVIEGGLSRNIALMIWIQNNIKDLVEIKLSNNRLINMLNVIYILLSSRKAKLIFQYPSVGMPLFNKSLVGKVVSWVFVKSVEISLKFNSVIFDVSDLKYDQSRDFGTHSDIIQRMKVVEVKLFGTDSKFIFASFSMQDFACKKYNILRENTEVLINGGNISQHDFSEEFNINQKKVNFVYAGTLNKGRNIDKMIKQFPNSDNIHLYLMGTDGDWIIKEKIGNNISYLGAYPEEEAHEVVKMCDIGLIPYDNNKEYFNIAYPTKLSFYVTAGISFLSTPVNEVLKIKSKYNIGFVEEIDNWAKFCNGLDKKNIKNDKDKVEKIKRHFTWDNIISESRFLNNVNN